MLVRKETDILELTEIVKGDFDVRCLHSLGEIEEIVVFSSIVNNCIKIIFFFILLFVFLLVLLFFIFIRSWLFVFIIRTREIINLAFILRVEIVYPFDSDWLGRLNSVLTFTVNILEKVKSGW